LFALVLLSWNENIQNKQTTNKQTLKARKRVMQHSMLQLLIRHKSFQNAEIPVDYEEP